MKLILVRHGQIPTNTRGILETSVPGPDLTDVGRAQAEALVDRFADEPIDGLYVSNLARTAQTAAPLAAARGLEPVVLDGLREVSAGELEGQGGAEAQRAYAEMLLSWFDPAVPEAALPGGETKAGFLARYDGAIGRITADLAENGGGTAVAVSHGGAIPAWVFSRAVTPGLKFDLSRPLSNTGVVMLAGGPSDGWTLQSWEGEDV